MDVQQTGLSSLSPLSLRPPSSPRPPPLPSLPSLSQANSLPAQHYAPDSHQLFPFPTEPFGAVANHVANPPIMRKRKAESQDNERLSKRLSLLNLEQNGQKLYVPVESPQLKPLTETAAPENELSSAPDTMHLDNTKHKVYIYNLDDELSDTDNSDSDSRSGSPARDRTDNLIFLPDIRRHLRQNRIPPAVFANRDGEYAGHDINHMQMVLYKEPSSLTVPHDQDSVRQAIIDARARMRAKQRAERESMDVESCLPVVASPASTSTTSAPRSAPIEYNQATAPMLPATGYNSSAAEATVPSTGTPWSNLVENDPDAMEMD
ncbi:hypothetical protein F5Y15DRAFT_421166 [Xylariaceae sp. FL0016]|nr:hypothetical protein F5Y15DRAFT_421166 [Xylariaceae sp. FL0016]